jgi:hypothetical protein
MRPVVHLQEVPLLPPVLDQFQNQLEPIGHDRPGVRIKIAPAVHQVCRRSMTVCSRVVTPLGCGE